MASTKEDFLAALEKADKAGDTEAAEAISADAITTEVEANAEAPIEKAIEVE